MTLKAEHLEKHYGQRIVVHDISLAIKQGEIVGLLGPNGAGKSTTFYLMLGLVLPTHGHVYLDEEDITQNPIHIRAQKGIGYLPQEASIFRELTVEKNILAALELRYPNDENTQFEKLEILLNDFHLQNVRRQKGLSLSGGERRRVEIARTLAMDPRFILLDEPFAGIDPIAVSEIKQLITDLKARNIGIFITDHNVRETLQICERAYIVNHGKILCAGTIDTILQSQEARKIYLGEDFAL